MWVEYGILEPTSVWCLLERRLCFVSDHHGTRVSQVFRRPSHSGKTGNVFWTLPHPGTIFVFANWWGHERRPVGGWNPELVAFSIVLSDRIDPSPPLRTCQFKFVLLFGLPPQPLLRCLWLWPEIPRVSLKSSGYYYGTDIGGVVRSICHWDAQLILLAYMPFTFVMAQTIHATYGSESYGVFDLSFIHSSQHLPHFAFLTWN